MSYFLLVIYICLIVFFLTKSKFFKSDTIPTTWIVIIFLSKFFAGISLWAIYAFIMADRASGDIFKYFDDGNIIFMSILENPLDYLRIITGIGSDAPHLIKYYDTCCFWFKDFNYGLINDNRIIIRFNAIVRLVSMGNIHIHTLFMSFLSFTGLWSIFKIIENRVYAPKLIILALIFFFPSVFFWTSGLLKEGILTFGFGLFILSAYKLLNEKFSVKQILILLASIFILVLSKFYVLVAVAPGILFLFFTKLFSNKSKYLTFISSHILFFIGIWVLEHLTRLDFIEIIANKQNDFINYVHNLKQVGSLIEMNRLDDNLLSLISNLPQGLYNCVFRPTIFEAKNALMLLAAFENILVILLIVLTIFYFNKKNLSNSLVWFSISFCIFLFGLIGITTPVLGAIVRYKAPALPFLGIMFLFLIDFHRIKWKKKAIFKDV